MAAHHGVDRAHAVPRMRIGAAFLDEKFDDCEPAARASRAEGLVVAAAWVGAIGDGELDGCQIALAVVSTAMFGRKPKLDQFEADPAGRRGATIRRS